VIEDTDTFTIIIKEMPSLTQEQKMERGEWLELLVLLNRAFALSGVTNLTVVLDGSGGVMGEEDKP
jgi:hypothetical protein